MELNAPKHEPRAGLFRSNSVLRYFRSCVNVVSVPSVYKADKILYDATWISSTERKLLKTFQKVNGANLRNKSLPYSHPAK